MSTISEVRARFTAVTNGFQEAVQTIRRDVSGIGPDTEASTTRASSGFSKLRESIRGFTDAYFGFEALKEGTMAIGKAFISSNADMETYTNTLTTLMHSHKAAVETMDWAVKFAASTPFEIPEIVDATAKLTSYGINAKDVLTDIGNMAAIMGKPLDQAVEAVADAQTGELERLKEFGITKQMLIDKAQSLYGKELVNTKGQITDQKLLNDTLMAVMKERYKGGMDVASQSFKGIVSNIQDAMGSMARELGKPVFDKLKEGAALVAPVMSAAVLAIKGDWSGVKDILGGAFGPDVSLKIENFFLLIASMVNKGKQAINDMKPSIDNLKIVFNNLMPVFKTIGEAFVGAFSGLTKVLPPIVNSVTSLAAKLTSWSGFLPVVGGLIAAFTTYKGLMSAIEKAEIAYNAVKKISIALYNAQRAAAIAYGIYGGGLTGVMQGMRAAAVSLNLAFLANPIVLIIAAIVGLVAALVIAYNKSETFRNFVNGMWDGIKKGFGAVIDWFSQTIPKWIDGIKNWFSGIWDWLKSFFGQWGTTILAVLVPFIGVPLLIYQNWGAIKDWLANLWNGIVAFFQPAVNMIMNIVNGLVSGVVGFFQNLFNTIMFIIQPFINFIVQSWENLKLLVLGIMGVFTSLLVGDWEGIKLGLLAIVTAIWRQIENIWTTIKDTVINLVTVLWNGLQAIWNGILNGVVAIANGIANGAIAAWNYLKDGAINAANGLYNGAINLFNSAKSGIVNIANNIASGVSNGFNNAKSWAINAISGLYNGVVGWFNNVFSSASSTASRVSSAFSGLNLYNIGSNIISGLYNGISNMASSVYRKAQEIADNIKNKIKSALGIHSPSRIMDAEVGQMVGAGLVQGLDKSRQGIVKASQRMFDAMGIKGVNKNLNAVATASLKSESVLTHVLDFANVPSHIDTDTLVAAMKNVFKNPTVQRQMDKVGYKNLSRTSLPKGV